MKKFGINNFVITEIEKVENPNILSDREKYWIKYFDTYYNGYNNTLGGDGALLYDYDYIWELWECGYKIKAISKVVGCNDFVVRMVLDIHNVSSEERLARSYDDQLNSHKPYQREVEQININTNEIIATYSSIGDAAKSVKMDKSSLGKVCRKGGIAKGYRWHLSDKNYIKKDFSARKVGKVDLKTKEIIEVFPSLTEAAKAVGGDTSYLSKVCRGIQKSSKGFGWKFLDD